jgi:hypothetical protein
LSTSGSFNPPSQPACVIPIDRAGLLALRAANGLDIQCHYRVPGPTIGTAGNTSPTQILMHAVSTNELSTSVHVDTQFGGTADTWPGGYDIDLGTAGSIFILVDDFNNRVSDSDVDAPTVHTQFPWHARGAFLRDNAVDDCTLIGWSAALAAGCTIVDNTLRETTVNLTGKTAGTFVRNTMSGGFLNSLVPTSFIVGNQLTGAAVDHQGTTAGSFSFQNNVMLTGSFTVDAATTSQVTANNNVVGGTAGGYRTDIQGRTGGLVIVSGNRMFSAGTGASELLIKGSSPGSTTVTTNELTATEINLDGSAGAINLTGSSMSATRITKDPASVGPLTVTSSKLGSVLVTVGPANAGTTNLVQQSTIEAGVVTFNGPVAGGGRNDIVGVTAQTADWVVAATATAGLHVSGGYYSSARLRQNRTGGTSSTAFFDCDMRGNATTVTDNGTVNPVEAPGVSRCQFRDTSVTIGNLAARSVGFSSFLQQVDAIGSTLNISGLGATGIVDKGRLTGANFNNGGFAIQTFEMLGGVKTLTANQNDRLFNPAFDNYI